MGDKLGNIREHTRIISPLTLKMKICAYINEAKKDPNGKLWVGPKYFKPKKGKEKGLKRNLKGHVH